MDKCECGANDFELTETLYHRGKLKNGVIHIDRSLVESGGFNSDIICTNCNTHLSSDTDIETV